MYCKYSVFQKELYIGVLNVAVYNMLLMRKPERKRSLGRPSRRWVGSIRMELVEVGCGDVDWIGLAQDRDRWRALVNSVLNLRVP
jgi:hypothetical protein